MLNAILNKVVNKKITLTSKSDGIQVDGHKIFLEEITRAIGRL